jgi:hypothetical protein
MREEFKQKLFETFTKIVNDLPDNFEELVETTGLFSINFALYWTDEKEILNECYEVFHNHLKFLKNNEFTFEDQYRCRRQYSDNSMIDNKDFEFSEIVPPPFKE